MRRMERSVAWFSELEAEDRAWVAQIVQAGIRSFVEWYVEDDGGAAGRLPERGERAIASAVFGAAPRALAGVISLQQTVELVRLSIDVVDDSLDDLLGDEAAAVHSAVLRYARDVAFAAAEVYARAAETRGAWDARLEALVVDAVLRAEPDDTLHSRASALGWSTRGGVVVVLGDLRARRGESDLVDTTRSRARDRGLDALCAVQGERLVVILGGADDPQAAAEVVLGSFSDDAPVVVGPVVDGLTAAHVSARVALAAHRAASGWPEAPRPVLAQDLLAERALAGDGHARRFLVDDVFRPLDEARGAMVETLAAYFSCGGSVEATGRRLFVHANTVRYRLRQVADVVDLDPTHPRDALTLQIALILGRQAAARL
ncbi:helix-turn-helix domain-containing protein [Nocardioides sp. CBS4Y-1]|uniref:Helix-turn-helix domain-containing protein n=2 Tax=Nocardioides acrostichi TaxID=2784339 RepID=A0A930Y8A3_9ACTN|nr:helix-turn-helix domain-containing protein [Nocardioides acrostichi]